MSDDTAAAAYTPAAREALQAFGIEPAQLALVTVSENVTFKVTNADRAYVLRLHRPGYHDIDELNSERVWIRALAEAGIDVPMAVLTTDGQEYTRVFIPATGEHRYVGLAHWTDGELLESVMRHTTEVAVLDGYFEQLGALCAAMHNQASGWAVPRGFKRHALDEDGLLGDAPFWGRFWEHPALEPDERRLLLHTRARVREVMQRFGRHPSTFSLIHADLHSGNLLIAGDVLTVIDFDDAGFGWHAYDIAVALIRYRDEPGFAEHQQAFARGYRAVRALPDEVLQLVPMFLMVRDMVILGWIHARPELGRRDIDGIKRRLCAQCEGFEAPL
jgi:Ser/Thr protein kinase RdoA (MazF antagonist)